MAMKLHEAEQKINDSKISQKPFGDIILHPSAPEQFDSKAKLPFFCQQCGFGKNGQWTVSVSNMRYSEGCDCCKRTFKVQESKRDFLKEQGLSLVPHYTHPDSLNSTPKNSTIDWYLMDKHGFQSEKFKSHSLVQSVRDNNTYPYRKQFERNRGIDEVVNEFEKTFPKGNAKYYSDKKSGTTTVGPFLEIWTGKRLMRPEITGEIITLKGVKGKINREKEDRCLDQTWREEATKYGAEILDYSYNGEVKIKYVSRTGYTRQDTIERAREVNWGQTRLKKGEQLCPIILKEIFPNSVWKSNKRFNFLTFQGNRLELDGYCEDLKLAFEHQGKQHNKFIAHIHKDQAGFNVQLERDLFKKKRCAEVGIRLLVINQTDLIVERYVETIINELKKYNYTFSDNLDIKSIEEKWIACLQNPNAELHNKIKKNLGNHELLTDYCDIHIGSMVDYICSNCKKINTVQARGFTVGGPRRYCSKCNLKNRKELFQTKLNAQKEDIPSFIFEKLNIGADGFSIVCEQNHTQDITLNNLEHHFQNGQYFCTDCYLSDRDMLLSKDNRAKVSTLKKRSVGFLRELKEYNLIPVGFTYHKQVSSKCSLMAVDVECQNKHVTSLSKHDFEKYKKNKNFRKDGGYHTYCTKCAYGDADPHWKKGHIFYRLEFLKSFHPNVVYVDGFDPSGKSMEEYNCGEKFDISGKEHPNFFIRRATIGSREKTAVFKTPCYVCALKNGKPLPQGVKTLDMIEGRMLFINELIANQISSSTVAYPSVVVVEGEQGDRNTISTTKTKIQFTCGVDGHKKSICSVDNYFNMNKGGYCKECLKEVNIKSVIELLS